MNVHEKQAAVLVAEAGAAAMAAAGAAGTAVVTELLSTFQAAYDRESEVKKRSCRFVRLEGVHTAAGSGR